MKPTESTKYRIKRIGPLYYPQYKGFFGLIWFYFCCFNYFGEPKASIDRERSIGFAKIQDAKDYLSRIKDSYQKSLEEKEKYRQQLRDVEIFNV